MLVHSDLNARGLKQTVKFELAFPRDLFNETHGGIEMMLFAKRFIKNESGATAVEYGLIAALIGVVIIAGAGALGQALNAKFNTISTTVSSAGT